MRLWLTLALLPAAVAQPAAPLGTTASIARGDKLFAQGCSVGYCHGAGGSAARSQRLRGRTFDRAYLIKVIRDGIPNTAMPAWRDRLTDADINDLSDYIQSLANAPIDVAGGPSTEAPVAASADKSVDIPEEHRHGRDLFFDLARESRCSVCHRLNGVGTPVGPDLMKVASLTVSDGPRVLKYGRPRTVRTVVLKDGEKFAAAGVERGAAMTRVYDLTTLPPVQRSLPNAEVQSVVRQSNWRHGGAVRGYSAEDLQAIWAYVRFVAAKK